ncbi:MAG: alanyl-tRNA editing protein [Clostridia bacterium]|nr:alanyl-tRNA editing protein [Clostridia bacterium]
MTSDKTLPPTKRLFDEYPTCLSFHATVLSCEQKKNAWEVVLDHTAFFPEGGGQGADHGTLGNTKVLDVHDRNGVIVHTIDNPLSVGETVQGEVDAERRLSNSQQHTGEHILSGIIHSLYGYNNVGFHIGSDVVTVDVGGVLTEDDLRRVERLANECVWRDVPVKAWFPTVEELKDITYRSKKEIDGGLRIVQIDGADTCACCGTHVASTGMVGQIKIIGAIHYKGGMRLSILCGMRALAYENALLDENRAVSHALSAKQGELAEAVLHLQKERDGLREELTKFAMEGLKREVEAQREQLVRVAVVSGLEGAGLPRAASLLAEGAQFGLALLPVESGWQFALCAESGAPGASKALCELFEAFGGCGGGGNGMAQGRLERGEPGMMRDLLDNLVRSGL